MFLLRWIGKEISHCLYACNQESIAISDSYKTFLSGTSSGINHAAKQTMQSFGYVMGRETLFNHVNQLQAGEMLVYDGIQLKVEVWFRINSKTIDNKNQRSLETRTEKHIF